MFRNPLPLLAVFLLLGAACDGDGTPGSTPTAPAPVASRTSLPEATSTPRPSVTPSPRSTVTATPAPSTATAVPPTPTATPRPDGLQFFFGPGVDDFDRSLITRAVEVTSELLSGGAEVQPPSAVFADSSPQRLATSFSENSIGQPWRSRDMVQRLSQTVAEASYRGIVINTGNPAWLELNAAQRVRAVAHEYVHVIQLEQAGRQAADATLSGPVTQVPPAGPFWLLEGSAEAVSWLVLQELGLGSYPESLFDYAADAAGSGVTLDSLASFIGYREGGPAGLGMAVLATDYLLRSRSLDALFDFWRDIGDGADWTTAFARRFGQPPVFFYIAFAAFYESTWAGFTP